MPFFYFNGHVYIEKQTKYLGTLSRAIKEILSVRIFPVYAVWMHYS